MMRVSLFALALGMGLGVSAMATAAPWNDPNGRVVFDQPAGWTTTVEQSAEYTYVVTGTANNECHIISRPNPRTASVSAAAVRHTNNDDAQFQAARWTTIANGMTTIFPNQSANVLSRSADSVEGWSIQRAEIQGPERLVHAALQLRPGFELMTYCMTYDGPDAIAVYDGVIRSVGTPNDATFRAQAAEVGDVLEEQNAAVAAENARIEEENAREARRRRVQH